MDVDSIDFTKENGLVPAVIQDYNTGTVLMLGFMDREAVKKTLAEGRVTFFSRTRKCLWTKGETSGNFLLVKDIKLDCDNDALLIKAIPTGAVCHTGTMSCFGKNSDVPMAFLSELTRIVKDRHQHPSSTSYTSALFQKGAAQVAQKVGEEAVELVIEALASDNRRFLDEAADLLYHFVVLLEQRGKSLQDVVVTLKNRREEAKR